MPPPPALKRYLGFSRLSPRSLEAVARVVERDEAFRERVADAVDEDQVGRAGWLWLARPAGWSGELEGLEAAAAAEAAEVEEQRAERAATKQLAAAQEAVRRAEAQVTAHLVELEELRAQLAHERDARAAAESRAEELAERVDSLTSARGEVVRNLKETEVRLVDRATEVNAAKARIRELEAEARAWREDPSRRERVAGDVPAPDDAGTEPPPPPGPHPEPAAGCGEATCAARPVGHGAAGPGVDQGAVGDQVARAAQGAAGLAAALGDLARLLAGAVPGSGSVAGDAPGPGGEGRDRTVAGPPATIVGTGGTSPPATAVPRARRDPVPLPGGMFDDTVEAAEHLLRTPGAVLVVDGYNITMTGWPDLGAAEQRRRLVTALSDLAARTSTQVEVVFDGAEVEPLTVPVRVRQLVRVRFSDPGVEADDVVIDLVGRIPAATPVIVASSDNRVRAGSRRWGANLLHARQLVDVLRR